MKKFLLSLFVLFSFITVSAATGGNVSNIKIENIEVKVSENVGYNEELEIPFSINPRDAKNLNLVWEVTGTKKGVTVEFVSSNSTNSSDGSIKIKVNNTLDKNVTLTLRAKQNGKVLSTTKLVVETKEETFTRLVAEFNALVNNLDEKINRKNYDSNLATIEKITELLEKNPEVKDELDDELLNKYETIKTAVNDYSQNNKTFVLVVSIILVIIFSVLVIWIFMKEDDE